jgi:molybdopterin molybdotransferase
VASSVASATDEEPVVLPVVAEVAAGGHSTRHVVEGEAVRIMTGAPLPAGVDAIVMVEDTERLDGGQRVLVRRSVQPGDAVRAAGDDVRVGTVLYDAGTLVTPAVAAVLASVNATPVRVVPRVRVAVLSTGDELVDDGSPLQPGQIRESNRTMLLGAVADAGCDAVDLGIVRDDEAALEEVLRHAAATCDAIVTSGGVSMGDYDVVKAVLGRIADMHWMQIAIKPAKPLAFASIGGVPVFGLPGNPVSSRVSFELLARPALRRLAGRADELPSPVFAVARSPFPRRPDGRVHFDRVVVEYEDGGYVCERSGFQASNVLSGMAAATGLAVLEDGDGVDAGERVPVLLL